MGRRRGATAPAVDVEPRRGRPARRRSVCHGGHPCGARGRPPRPSAIDQRSLGARFSDLPARFGADESRPGVDGAQPRSTPTFARQRDRRVGLCPAVGPKGPPRSLESPFQARRPRTLARRDHRPQKERLRHPHARLAARASSRTPCESSGALAPLGVGAAPSRRIRGWARRLEARQGDYSKAMWALIVLDEWVRRERLDV
jgi:hypothetical protein